MEKKNVIIQNFGKGTLAVLGNDFRGQKPKNYDRNLYHIKLSILFNHVWQHQLVQKQWPAHGGKSQVALLVTHILGCPPIPATVANEYL